jgi:hypothetical protein
MAELLLNERGDFKLTTEGTAGGADIVSAAVSDSLLMELLENNRQANR